MKIYYSTDHDSHHPVGCASVVMAENEQVAWILLAAELEKRGLDPEKDFTLRELQPGTAIV